MILRFLIVWVVVSIPASILTGTALAWAQRTGDKENQ